MTDDILSKIDDTVEERCACGCGTPLPPASDSAYFLNAEHQRDWHQRQAIRPEEVGGSLTVSPDQMRWRPDLVTAEPDGDLALIDGETLGYTGRFNAAVYRRDGQPDMFHLRLDDGYRFVGADLAGEVADESAANTWRRLEGDLTNQEHLAPLSATNLGWSWAPHVTEWGAAVMAAGLTWTGASSQVVIDEPFRVTITPETQSRLVRDMEEISRYWNEAMVPAARRAFESFAPVAEAVRDRLGSFHLEPAEADREPTDPMERALWLRRHRNTGPAKRQRTPRRIDPRRSR